MDDDKQFPCGHCEAGVYAWGAVEGGYRLFGACQTRREALKAAPRCKHRPAQICMGSRDFIVASTFPLPPLSELTNGDR